MFARFARITSRFIRLAAGLALLGAVALLFISGEDENGKTDDLGPILVRVDTTFDTIAGVTDPAFRADVLEASSFCDRLCCLVLPTASGGGDGSRRQRRRPRRTPPRGAC